MKINNNTKNKVSPTFQKLYFMPTQNRRLFFETYCKAKLNINNKPVERDYFLKIEKTKVPDEYCIKVSDGKFNPLGTSKITIDGNTMYNNSIITKDNMHGMGAGSVMRLGQIITMIENHLDKIELSSLASAVHFHSKFKFEPLFKTLENISDFIKKYILKQQGNENFKKVYTEANDWLGKNATDENEKLKLGNNIIYEYLQTINKNRLCKDPDYQIKHGFDMVLTKENISKNREFFNELFKKFGIDYKITDSSY